MREFILLFLSLLIAATFQSGIAEGRHNDCITLSKKSYNLAADNISKPKKAQYLIVTNLPSVVGDNPECSIIPDELSRLAGVSQGKGNLIVLQDSPNKPPFIFFYNPINDRAFYLEIDKKIQTIKTAKSRKDFLELIRKDGDFEVFSKEKPFGGNEYRLIMITSLWAKGLMSHDVINSIRLHNHYCPGVTSGYHIGRFIIEALPLSEGESYVFIASPMWCKDDAIQVMLDATVGKRSMYAFPLKDKEKTCLVDEAKNIAGIIFRYNRAKKEGEAIVLKYDWDGVRKDAGVGDGVRNLANAVKQTQYMMSDPYIYKKYVGIIKKMKLKTGETPEDFIGIGINPFEKLELWKEGCSAK